MPDNLLRTCLERLDAQWREEASQMHADDRAVQARTLTDGRRDDKRPGGL